MTPGISHDCFRSVQLGLYVYEVQWFGRVMFRRTYDVESRFEAERRGHADFGATVLRLTAS